MSLQKKFKKSNKQPVYPDVCYTNSIIFIKEYKTKEKVKKTRSILTVILKISGNFQNEMKNNPN